MSDRVFREHLFVCEGNFQHAICIFENLKRACYKDNVEFEDLEAWLHRSGCSCRIVFKKDVSARYVKRKYVGDDKEIKHVDEFERPTILEQS